MILAMLVAAGAAVRLGVEVTEDSIAELSWKRLGDVEYKARLKNQEFDFLNPDVGLYKSLLKVSEGD